MKPALHGRLARSEVDFFRSRRAEQIVGPERRERVSHQTWCGEGWMKSRRPVNSDVRRLASMIRRYHWSFALLGAVCLLTLTCSSRHASTHKTDQEMIANFQTHRADFDELLKMFRADKGLLYYSNGRTLPENVQSLGITAERLNQYQVLFARLGLDGMGDSSRVGLKDEVWFFTSIEGPRQSTFKHYAFVTQPARGLVNDLDYGASKSAPYRHIDDRWYLALDDAD